MTVRLLALLIGLLAGHAHAAGWDVAALMKTLAGNGGGKVRFVETRHLAILDQPLSTTGELVYRAPARLERHTETPVRESMVLDGDTLTLTREGKTHSLRLRDYPEVAALIESIRATLAGDRKTLERSYALSLSGTAEQWSLDLLPSDPAVAKVVLRISIGGSRGEVRTVDILQADGDRSEMRIEPVPR
ncbi:MAG: LolA-related protein [Azoarcus sp.]|jgi:outer membrane lipoprotein-sorting protein|nr:outer membrane lipoprotein carrier protein LolA [Azoarcus sp.]MDD2872045.1 outer-membrane lipoprotein carrier protein LolA [Azoarcus sp.]MDX9836980.1 LolA-related protein [Azoarcus sp.]